MEVVTSTRKKEIERGRDKRQTEPSRNRRIEKPGKWVAGNDWNDCKKPDLVSVKLLIK